MSKTSKYSNYLSARLDNETELLGDVIKFVVQSYQVITAALESKNVDGVLGEFDILKVHQFTDVTDAYLIDGDTLAVETIIEAVDDKDSHDREVMHIKYAWFSLWCLDKEQWQADYSKHVESLFISSIEQKLVNAAKLVGQKEQELSQANQNVEAYVEAVEKLEQEQQTKKEEQQEPTQ